MSFISALFQRMFQCSSASRKFSMRRLCCPRAVLISFSALQRAENSQSSRSPAPGACPRVSVLFSEPKILNFVSHGLPYLTPVGFSALQRAENSQSGSSLRMSSRCAVSVLFSEPKILNRRRRLARVARGLVSVLFSEPKILNNNAVVPVWYLSTRFSALQRAENSQYVPEPDWHRLGARFSALQRAENSQSTDGRIVVAEHR